MTSPLTELQAAILNLPCKVPAEFSDDEAFILKIGFNEARQKAASLASAHASQVEALRASHAQNLTDSDTWWPVYECELEKARGTFNASHFNTSAPVWFEVGWMAAVEHIAGEAAKLAEQPNSFHLAASPSERTLEQKGRTE